LPASFGVPTFPTLPVGRISSGKFMFTYDNRPPPTENLRRLAAFVAEMFPRSFESMPPGDMMQHVTHSFALDLDSLPHIPPRNIGWVDGSKSALGNSSFAAAIDKDQCFWAGRAGGTARVWNQARSVGGWG
jgi:hypothetical protein